MMQEIMWPLLNRFLWQNEYWGMNRFPFISFILSVVIIIFVGILTYICVERPAINKLKKA